MTKYIYRNFLIVLAVDVFLVAFSWYLAHLLRFNFDIPPDTAAVMSHILPVALLVKVITFYLFDLYKGMWRYTSIDDVINIIKKPRAWLLSALWPSWFSPTALKASPGQPLLSTGS